MKKKMTITGIFNDFFTGYKDKESSVSFVVDTEKDCTCDEDEKRCLIHNPPSNYILTDINSPEV